jgi:hypothetical protein
MHSCQGADGVSRVLQCPGQSRHALLVEFLWPKDWGKPSLGTIINTPWYHRGFQVEPFETDFLIHGDR